MAAIRFGNDQVSGTGIRYDMNATSLAFQWDNLVDVDQQPSKAIASGLDVRLPAGRYYGHGGPTVTVGGVIDTSLSDPTYRSTEGINAPQVTLSALGSFALLGSGYLLYPAITQFLGKHPVATGSISAMILGMKITPDINSFRAGSEYMINYSMDLALVSGPV